MAREVAPTEPTRRRYSKEEEDQAVRLVFQFHKELGTSQGTVIRIANQLGYGSESVRRWVAQAEIDAGDAAGMEKLEQENREVRRANEILKQASGFLASMST